jgi:peptide/nickel transport system substrate-binding protein
MTFYGTSATGAAWIVPKKYVEKVGEDGFKKAPIGAGPYRVVSFTPGVDLVMEAFEGYWRKVPSVKRLSSAACPTRPRAPPRSRRATSTSCTC